MLFRSALKSYRPQVRRDRRVHWRGRMVAKTSIGTPVPELRDPCLPSRRKPAAYVDVFVDDFVDLAQQQSNSRRVRRTLMHAIDSVECTHYFRTLSTSHSNSSRVPLPCHSINSARRRSYKSETYVTPVEPKSACPVRLPPQPHPVPRRSDKTLYAFSYHAR